MCFTHAKSWWNKDYTVNIVHIVNLHHTLLSKTTDVDLDLGIEERHDDSNYVYEEFQKQLGVDLEVSMKQI